MNRPAPTAPPWWLRLVACVCRAIPPVRGRGRLEKYLHRRLAGHGWEETLPVNGYSLRLPLDGLIGRNIYMDGVFECGSTAMTRALVRPGQVVVDGGANEGYFSLLFATLVTPSGKVLAFEPIAETAAALRHNLQLNPALAPIIELRETALSSQDGELAMNIAGVVNNGQSHVAPPTGAPQRTTPVSIIGQTRIPGRSLDSLWRELGRPRIHLVKLDVEAHELPALEGMAEILAQDHPPKILVEVKAELLVTMGQTPASIFEFLIARGFHSYDWNGADGSFTLNDTPRTGELILFSREKPGA